MNRLLPSLAFCLLLAASLGLKATPGTEGPAASGSQDEDIPAFLGRHGFAVTPGDPAENPVWTVGTKPGCRIEIATVAPQGWHRAVVAERGAGQRIVYVYGGRTYAEQPVLHTLLGEYRRRLERYLGVAAPPIPVRALILSPGCPADLPDVVGMDGLSA